MKIIEISCCEECPFHTSEYVWEDYIDYCEFDKNNRIEMDYKFNSYKNILSNCPLIEKNILIKLKED